MVAMFEYMYVWSPLFIFLPFGWSLSVTDYRTHKLPNRQLLKASCVVFSSVAALAYSRNDSTRFLESLKIACFCLAVFVILYLCSRGQLGMGDVKYSFLLGLIIGWINPDGWMIFIWISFAFAAFWTLGKSMRQKIQIKDHVAFGPFLTIAAVTTCLWILV